MTKRVTFKVTKFRETVNEMLLKTAPELVEIRQGMMNILELVLHESGNYKGFQYLTADQVKGNPGIRHGADGYILPYPERFENTDKTRVRYF